MPLTTAEISPLATKQLRKFHKWILNRLLEWIDEVEELGINKTRESSGYHDEPLKGIRQGQRSIRLNRSYRAIYVQARNGELTILTIQEVHNHEY
jgi:toxin HigB-1